MVNGKATIILLIAGLMKMTVYFSKPKPLQGNLEFELDYPNSLDKKTNNIFSTKRFNHTMIFFKLTV